MSIHTEFFLFAVEINLYSICTVDKILEFAIELLFCFLMIPGFVVAAVCGDAAHRQENVSRRVFIIDIWQQDEIQNI